MQKYQYIFVEATTMSLRGPVPTPTCEARRAEFDGTGRDGTDGTDGEQKCPLILFIFCVYIDKIYIYLYTKKKVVTNILMGFKIWCQVGGRDKKFQIYTR